MKFIVTLILTFWYSSWPHPIFSSDQSQVLLPFFLEISYDVQWLTIYYAQ